MLYMFYRADGFVKCNTMTLDTSSCPNVAVHNSFKAQNPSMSQSYNPTFSAKTYQKDAVAE